MVVPVSSFLVCAVCARVLDRHPSGWAHAAADRPEDHPAVPVAAGEVEVRGRCDFCSADDPVAELPATTFLVGAIGGSVGAWAACRRCAALIRAGDWAGLEQRAVDAQEMLHGPLGPETRAMISGLYSRLRAHVVGPLRPMVGGR